MHRVLYFVGVGYLALCGMIVLRHRQSLVQSRAAIVSPGVTGDWWARSVRYRVVNVPPSRAGWDATGRR